MALEDIKDAGGLAGFVRWGWPYHGLCEGGAIGSSGQTIPQPDTGHTWLIDRNLPALDISPAEIAAEALEGREWLNYALISGGSIYGTALPTVMVGGSVTHNSYIHIDSDGAAWLITLTCSYPSTNVVRVTADIVRFGLFDETVGEMTPIQKQVDVSCVMTELAGNAETISGYYYRNGRLHDVHTNGSKALVCIEMVQGSGDIDVTSAIEVTFSGAGGTDGGGLVMAGVEQKTQHELTVYGNVPHIYANTVNTGVFRGYTSTSTGNLVCTDELQYALNNSTIPVVWPWETGYNYPVDGGTTKTVCRYCLYDAGGNVVAARFREKHVWVGAVHVTSAPTIDNPLYSRLCGTPYSFLNYSMSLVTTYTRSYAVLHNDSVVDEIGQDILHSATVDVAVGLPPPGSINYYPAYSKTRTWRGSITSGFPDIDLIPLNSLIYAWSSLPYAASADEPIDGSITVGIYRVGYAHSFYLLSGSTRTYGTVGTPFGNQSTAQTGAFYYSGHRKTGAVAFSANPICYV